MITILPRERIVRDSAAHTSHGKLMSVGPQISIKYSFHDPEGSVAFFGEKNDTSCSVSQKIKESYLLPKYIKFHHWEVAVFLSYIYRMHCGYGLNKISVTCFNSLTQEDLASLSKTAHFALKQQL